MHRSAWRNCPKVARRCLEGRNRAHIPAKLAHFASFRRILPPSFLGRTAFLDSFGRGILRSPNAASCISSVLRSRKHPITPPQARRPMPTCRGAA
jgi:hypothetical protein